jgi:hypothetical protein
MLLKSKGLGGIPGLQGFAPIFSAVRRSIPTRHPLGLIGYARIRNRHPTYLVHFSVGQSKVEDREIFLEALGLRSSWYGDQLILLYQPSERCLDGALTVLVTNRHEAWVVQPSQARSDNRLRFRDGELRREGVLGRDRGDTQIGPLQSVPGIRVSLPRAWLS